MNLILKALNLVCPSNADLFKTLTLLQNHRHCLLWHWFSFRDLKKHLIQLHHHCLSHSSCNRNYERMLNLIGGFWLLALKFLGDSRDLQMVLCHYINAGLVVGIPWDGGSTQSLPYAKEFWAFCTRRWQGCKNFRCKQLHTGKSDHAQEPQLWNFHNIKSLFGTFNVLLTSKE